LDFVDTDNSSAIPLSLSLNGSGLITTTKIQTSDPSGGTAIDWRLGSVATGAVTVDTTRYVQVQIGASAYKFIIAQ
jgi:hypothetical protein